MDIRSLTKKEIKVLPWEIYQAFIATSRREPIPSPRVRELDSYTRNYTLKGTQSGTEFAPGGVCFPFGLLRALAVDTFTAGGALVGTESVAFDPIPRAASVVLNAGARVIDGLSGNVEIDRETAALTPEWLTETEEATPADGTFGSLNLRPHRCTGVTSLSSQLEVQTGGVIIPILSDSISAGIGSAITKAALVGNGVAGEPSGLYSAASVGTVTFGGPAAIAKVADFEEQITTNNGIDENISFVAHPQVRQKLKELQRWSSASVAFWTDDEKVLGKRAFVTSAMGTTDICAGDFSKMIVAFWGQGAPVQLIADPYSLDLQGRIRLVVNVFADTGLLRPNQFVKNADSAVQ